MILAFKPQFVEPILSGSKIHTIRHDQHNRWREGMAIQMATGVRTKNYNCFKKEVCTEVQDVFMTYAYNDLIQISVDGRELFGFDERMAFAQNDGFNTWQDFFKWFYPIIMKSPKECFTGKLIHWTDKRY